MKKETEGYFVIKFKNKEMYVSDDWYDTNLIEDAKPFETFQELYSQIKESKLRYRFPLESCKNLAVFSKNSIRNYQTLYKFI